MTDLEKYTSDTCEINLAGIKWTNIKSKTQYQFFIKHYDLHEKPELIITFSNGLINNTTFSIDSVESSCFITFENIRYKVVSILHSVKPSTMELENSSGQIEFYESRL